MDCAEYIDMLSSKTIAMVLGGFVAGAATVAWFSPQTIHTAPDQFNEDAFSAMQSQLDALDQSMQSIALRLNQTTTVDKTPTDCSSLETQAMLKEVVRDTLINEFQQRSAHDLSTENLSKAAHEEQFNRVINTLETRAGDITHHELIDDINALTPASRQKVYQKISGLIEAGQLDPQTYFK